MSSRKSKEELTQEVGTVITGVRKEQRSKTPSERTAIANRKVEAQKKVAEITVGKAAQQIANLGVSIQATLGAVNTELQTKLAELAKVEEVIALKKVELEDLHGKDVLASSLDVLATTYGVQQEEQAAISDAVRESWVMEENEHYRQVTARDAALLDLRRREEEQYNYTRELDRKTATDRWTDTVIAKQREQAEQERLFTRNHAEREENLKARELDLSNRKQQVETQLTEERNKLVASNHAALAGQKRDFEHQMELLKRDTATDTKLLQAQLTSMSNELAHVRNDLKSAQGQVSEANTKVAEIAKQAIDGASGKLALDQVMAIKQTDTANGRKS